MPTQSMQQIIVRNAGRHDAPTLAAFNRDMALETENMTLTPKVILDGVTAVLENPAHGFYVVAEARGAEYHAKVAKVVGSLLVTTEWSDWRNGAFWWIQSVYVTREWRRRGVYRLLYDHLKRLAARDKDVCGFRLYVERENRIAQTTYADLGMVETRYKIFEQILSRADSESNNLESGNPESSEP